MNSSGHNCKGKEQRLFSRPSLKQVKQTKPLKERPVAFRPKGEGNYCVGRSATAVEPTVGAPRSMSVTEILGDAKRIVCLLAWLFAAILISGCAGSQIQGTTYTRHGDGSIGPLIPGVALSFVREDGSAISDTTSDANGRYLITLSPGRYYMLATHADYADYNSAPGFLVVSADTGQIANFFLRAPQITTVLLVRHAEKQNPSSDVPSEPLSTAGHVRAEALREALLRAGVTAVYATEAIRTQDTVAPLAAAFRLPTRVYTDVPALAADVLAQHLGDVILVAAHSNTVATVANAFGAQVPIQAIGDHDNLYVASVTSGVANVVNLQYGAGSTPDIIKNDRRAMTLLLVGTVAPGSSAESEALRHAATKSGATAMYTSVPENPLIAPLATALDLIPVTFNSVDIGTFVNHLLSAHAEDTVVVAGTHEELRQLIRQLGAQPFPVLYVDDIDHLLVVTRFPSGEIRVVPLQY